MDDAGYKKYLKQFNGSGNELEGMDMGSVARDAAHDELKLNAELKAYFKSKGVEDAVGALADGIYGAMQEHRRNKISQLLRESETVLKESITESTPCLDNKEKLFDVLFSKNFDSWYQNKFKKWASGNIPNTLDVKTDIMSDIDNLFTGVL